MTSRSVIELISQAGSGTRLKYLFFWGHEPRLDGSIGAGCLSQWWPSSFNVDGNDFATAEHWMMWSKAILFGDNETAELVLGADHPHRAKALGRQVRGFDQATWMTHRFDIVVAGSVAKFSQHKDLGEYLVGTGERVLVEASPVDAIWGIGLASDDPGATDPTQWRGENLLGFALMQARQLIR